MNAAGDRMTSGGDTAAFDALPTGTAVLDSDGVIVRTNRAWREFGAENGLGDPESGLGTNYLAVCVESDDEDGRAVGSGLRELLAGNRTTFTYEYPCHEPEGEQRWFLLRAVRFGSGPNVLVMHVDITERKLAELALADHNDHLETVTAVLSHDVRNPLNVAQARTEMLAEETDSDHLEPLLRSLDRMEAIIDDAVNLARGSAGIDLRPVALTECAREAWDHVETADATLELEAVPTLSADRKLLMQLLENLFANAVKHGGSDVTVTVEPTDDGFAVTDTGPGIDPDDRPAVFEAGVSHGRAGGTGLGLAIVDKIATAHGWTVTAVDDPRGARVEVALSRDSETPPPS